MFVPRVYGLGDLSQILDDRAYVQTSVLVESAKDQISTFVVTDAYRRAARALSERGFVLLLGEPAVGKSSIALMLAIGAADNWGCANMKPRSSEELVHRWNPHEESQFFWVDDAFGAVRHERYLTDGWARDLPHVMSAVRNGARVVLTSRTYIYKEARPFLKTYAYPLLHEQEVTIDVSDITRQERRQILYNHLAAGDQPQENLSRMKPHLEDVADVEPFRPEAARRLGLRAFTRNLSFDRSSIEDFMARPHQFLSDVYGQLDFDSQAALALVYVNPRGLSSPLSADEKQCRLIERLGGTVGATGRALNVLVGTFLQSVVEGDGKFGWHFKHPTLREGFAAWLINQHHLLPVILAGMDDSTLLSNTHCLAEDESNYGTLLRMPAALYRDVAVQLRRLFDEWPEGSCWTGDAIRYLGEKCSDEMLLTALSEYPALPWRLTDFFSSVSDAPEPALLARLAGLGSLPEACKERVVARMAHLAVNRLDTAWLTDAPWDQILTSSDRAIIFHRVRHGLIPRLAEAVRDDWTSDWIRSGRVRDPLVDSLRTYGRAFEDIGDVDAVRTIKHVAETLLGDRLVTISEGQTALFALSVAESPELSSSRSVFSDLDEGP